jgi:hypothetical protein
MSERITMSTQTQTNWLIDAALFVSAVLAALSGVYFLLMPSGGYQGGRNPWYGVTVLFSRQTWSDLHTWGGVLMIAAAVVHFAIHWGWIKMMSKRVVNAMLCRGSRPSRGARFNVLVDALIALSFLVTAVSGAYLLFAPTGGLQGGRNAEWDPGFLFSRTTWDLIHTWAGVILIVAAVVHFWIHWRWVKNVTKRFFLSLWQRPAREEVPAVR